MAAPARTPGAPLGHRPGRGGPGARGPASARSGAPAPDGASARGGPSGHRPGSPRGGATPARRCAHRVVRRVFADGAYADRAFRAEADRAGLDARDRAFAQRLAYGTVQRRLTLDHVLGAVASRRLAAIDPPLLDALRLGTFELLYSDGVPDRAAVEQAVELAGSLAPRGRGFANAVMRRAAREGAGLVAALRDDTPAGAALAHSHPEWLVRRWWEALGSEEARALLARDNVSAETALRVDERLLTHDEAMAALARAGAAPRPAPGLAEGIVLGAPFDLAGSELFRLGAITPQSRASMLVGRMLDPRPGERVLDLCAAPGAKTTHLATLMRGEGELVAVERHPGRAAELRENLRRLGAPRVEVHRADGRDADLGAAFDRILVDAPCSDLGTLQARPDARWRKDPAQVEGLRTLQAELLAAAARRLRPGGTLVYSTCTISPPENAEQVERFLAAHPDFSADDLGAEHPDLRDPQAPRFLQLLPHRHATEGFFVARLRRVERGPDGSGRHNG